MFVIKQLSFHRTFATKLSKTFLISYSQYVCSKKTQLLKTFVFVKFKDKWWDRNKCFQFSAFWCVDKLDLDLGGGGQAVSKVLVTQMLQTVDAKNHFSLVTIIITSNIVQFLYFQKKTALLRDVVVNSIIIKNSIIRGNHNCQTSYLHY